MFNQNNSNSQKPKSSLYYLLIPVIVLCLALATIALILSREDRIVLSKDTDSNLELMVEETDPVADSLSNKIPAALGDFKNSAAAGSPTETIKNDKNRAKDKENTSSNWPTVEEIHKKFKQARLETFDPRVEVTVLRIFLDEQIVAAWTSDAKGGEELLKVFPCSTGYIKGHTPLGQYEMGIKLEQAWLFDNSLAQYSGQITGPILFHSLPSYDGSNNSGIDIEDLNSIGYKASHGCVRLFCIDAKWIYDYCPAGTKIEVLQNRGSDYRYLPETVNYLRLKAGAPTWDPSDPDPSNPYHDLDVLEQWTIENPDTTPFEVKIPVWPEVDLSSGAEAHDSEQVAGGLREDYLPLESSEENSQDTTNQQYDPKSPQSSPETNQYAPTAPLQEDPPVVSDQVQYAPTAPVSEDGDED